MVLWGVSIMQINTRLPPGGKSSKLVINVIVYIFLHIMYVLT